MTVPKKIAVALWTTGRVADEGMGAWFHDCSQFVCLPFRERLSADVLLFLAPHAAERALAAMKVPAAGRSRPSVLVTDWLDPQQMAEATGQGMTRFLDHSMAGLSEVADALVAAVAEAEAAETVSWPRSSGGQAPPPDATYDVGGGLSSREVEVLRLLAAGHQIAEISAQLNYSERTIKGIVHDVVNRFGFKNRVQAVVYGIRIGAF